MKKIGISTAIILLLVILWATKLRPDEVLAYEIKDFTFSGRDTLKYQFFEPMQHTEKRYPLLVFLHGAGARGSNNITQMGMISPYLLDSITRKKYPCFLLVPQCKKGPYGWPDMRNSLLSSPLEEVERIVRQKIADNLIDTNRIYLMGHSMGAAGVWEMMDYQPNKYAAAVVMCGWTRAENLAKIKHIPIWAFHGAKDLTVGPESIRETVADLRHMGSAIKYTEYPDGEHSSWKMVFEEPGLLPWLFSQGKKEAQSP